MYLFFKSSLHCIAKKWFILSFLRYLVSSSFLLLQELSFFPESLVRLVFCLYIKIRHRKARWKLYVCKQGGGVTGRLIYGNLHISVVGFSFGIVPFL